MEAGDEDLNQCIMEELFFAKIGEKASVNEDAGRAGVGRGKFFNLLSGSKDCHAISLSGSLQP
jgi:hypothetical protein